jgi:hypothetical protein
VSQVSQMNARKRSLFVTAALWAALGSLALLGPSRLARADSSCGGGSHDGHHGSSSWSGDLSSGRYASAARCDETSDVVGYRRCTKFGAWGTDLRVPRGSFEGGVVVRQFASLLDRQTGSVIHGYDQFVYRVVSPPPAQQLDTAVMSTVRANMALSHGLYTALEVDLGALAQPGRATTEMMSSGIVGTPTLRQERGFVVDGFATVGLRGAGRAGALALEMSGGMRGVSYSFHSSYLACETSSSIRAYAPLAEARARGELWLGPWLTAGVTVGTSMLERDAWMGGVYLGVHTRAFGGDR